MYPDFLGIGAQKAGTTWLYRNLAAHPGIWMPPRKEIHYLDGRARARGRIRGLGGPAAGWARDRLLGRPGTKTPLWGARYHAGGFDDRWYASLFEPGRGRVVGEITPSYSVLDRDAVAHAHALMPEAGILFFMRNPVERVWSQVVMSFDRRERGSAGSAESGRLLRRSGRRNPRRLTDYLRTLETWGEFYPPERIFVGFLEDVHLFPEELLTRLYTFLGVDPTFRPPSPDARVHTRSVGRLPLEVAARLAEDYGEDISRLGERFGGYADFWSYCAERLTELLAERATGGHVPYPFVGSSLWEEWVRSVGEPRRAQSGTLDLVRR